MLLLEEIMRYVPENLKDSVFRTRIDELGYSIILDDDYVLNITGFNYHVIHFEDCPEVNIPYYFKHVYKISDAPKSEEIMRYVPENLKDSVFLARIDETGYLISLNDDYVLNITGFNYHVIQFKDCPEVNIPYYFKHVYKISDASQNEQEREEENTDNQTEDNGSTPDAPEEPLTASQSVEDDIVDTGFKEEITSRTRLVNGVPTYFYPKSDFNELVEFLRNIHNIEKFRQVVTRMYDYSISEIHKRLNRFETYTATDYEEFTEIRDLCKILLDLTEFHELPF